MRIRLVQKSSTLDVLLFYFFALVLYTVNTYCCLEGSKMPEKFIRVASTSCSSGITRRRWRSRIRSQMIREDTDVKWWTDWDELSPQAAFTSTVCRLCYFLRIT